MCTTPNALEREKSHKQHGRKIHTSLALVTATMDIRSFFQKKAPGGSNGSSSTKKKLATPAKPAKRSEPEPTPPSRPTGRRTTKQTVVVLDDSDEDEKNGSSKRKAPAQKKAQRVDSDSDFEMQPSDNEVKEVTPKKEPLKRLRRAVKADSDEDEEMPEVKPEAKKEVKIESKQPATSSSKHGKTFAFSGVLESLSREDAVHLVKSCGGSVANSITRSTKYLVIGSTLEQGGNVTDGSKYKEAVAKNVRILTQNEFYNLITEAATAQQTQDLAAEKAKIKAETGALKTSSKGNQKLNTSINDELWTDKYKPQTLNHMIGNIELGKKLKTWLLDWEAMHVKGTKKVRIGKTTIANLVARECGFACTELNASDTRSKKMLQTGLKDVLGTQALQFGAASGKSKEKMHLARRVIIMDEVDGMSGGDRGGTAELIQLLKKSKTPIICICNDRQSQKVRSLANHSFDLRMRRPTKVQIGKRLMEIGLNEGLHMEKNAVEEAADRCGNDIRQLLTQMQRWRLTTTKITYADMVNPSSQHNKDESLRLNPFSATQQIFQRELSFDARNEAYFVDYDLMPLMVQENYIQSIMNNRRSSDENLEAAMHASEFISESDLLNTYVRVEQRWDLLTKQAAMNVGACVYSAGFIGHPEFSKWLGKNSSASKSKRLLSELSVRMRAHASGSREVIRLDYVPYMKEILLKKLLSGEDNIHEVIELLDECEISREDLTESMESFKFPGVKRHSYSELDTKAKTAFTRMYNKASHKSQAVVEAVLGSTTIKKARGKTAVAKDDGSGLPPPSDAESEPEEEDVDVSKFQKKPRGGAKRKAPAATAKKAPRKTPAKKRRT
ncbi:Replication factor RFC1 C terminal domain [Phytophthora infestans]|uniref:Replication factor C subunit 1 n=1 Tax=Phytophthora infestans TaxID=4787 RepID=A0A833SAT0_PHYIN|nr:Replication factor RFC1 C terminal domain [Phytophthora infestans]